MRYLGPGITASCVITSENDELIVVETGDRLIVGVSASLSEAHLGRQPVFVLYDFDGTTDARFELRSRLLGRVPVSATRLRTLLCLEYCRVGLAWKTSALASSRRQLCLLLSGLTELCAEPDFDESIRSLDQEAPTSTTLRDRKLKTSGFGRHSPAFQILKHKKYV